MDNNINININNETDDDAGDNRGKFSDKLKKIRRDKLKVKNVKLLAAEKKENILKTGARNIFKIFLAVPGMAYSVIKDDIKKETTKKVDSLTDDNNNYEITKINDDTIDTRRIKVNKIREMNVSTLRKKKEIALKKHQRISTHSLDNNLLNKNSKSIYNNENDIRIINLQKEIIDLIKKRLVKNINELEILQSELYLIKVIDNDETYLKDCHEKIKEIKKLLSRINSLKEKYDYLKDTYDFEYMYEHGDEVLVDKILELKDLCNRDDIKFVIDNYKILEEYKFLYLKIDKLQEETIKYEDYKNKKELELKERDINFEELKNATYNVDKEKQKYDLFVMEQETLLKQLESKIHDIDRVENVTYNLKGFNQLLTNSFKYMGLMLLSPFRGLVPSIAIHTAMTKNVIHNLHNNLEWQEKKEIIYKTVDYSNVINTAQSNLENTLNLVNSTLQDISNLKIQYVQEFSKYQNEIPGYKDTIKKINKIENAIMGNKVKIEIMQARMKIKEKENKNKIERVKKLNKSNNNC